jgi:transcriptional regulator with XRE-family HTH domain
MRNTVTKIGVTNLRSIRKARGLTQWGLRELTNVSVATISYIEKNGYYPMQDTRAKIAVALDMSEVEIWPEL